MDRWKAEMGRVREEKRRRKIKDKKNEKKEDLGARKGRTVAIHCVFPVICGSGGSKSKLGAMWPDERWKVARRCGAKHIRSAIRDSQQPSFPIGFLFWNFRHRLVRYYWDRTVTKNEGKKRDNHASPVSGIPCSKQFWRIWIIKAPSAQPLHGCDMQQFWVGKRDYESARKWTEFKQCSKECKGLLSPTILERAIKCKAMSAMWCPWSWTCSNTEDQLKPNSTSTKCTKSIQVMYAHAVSR